MTEANAAADPGSSATPRLGEVPHRDEGASEDARPWSVYAIAGVAAFVSIVVSGSALAGYHALFGHKEKIGMVDIAGILETSEAMFTEILAKPNVTDADREAAYTLVRQTGPRLEAALSEVQAACGCLLLAKAAVVGAGAIDYTPQVKASIGIDKVDLGAVQGRIRDAMSSTKKEGKQ